MGVTATGRTVPGDWYAGTIPDNARLGVGAFIETSFSFSLCRSRAQPAVTMGEGASTYLGTMFDLGERACVQVGRYALLHGVRIICDETVEIGDYALLSWNVVIMDTYRLPADPGLRRPLLRAQRAGGPPPADDEVPTRPVRLHPNVWIGFETCILPGVTVGEGSIVGARSVVTEDVPPMWIAAGNPARLIRPVDQEDRSR